MATASSSCANRRGWGGRFAPGAANEGSPVRRWCHPAAAALFAASQACTTVTNVPPGQLPRLLATRREDIEIVDNKGDKVTISRSLVREVNLEPRANSELKVPAGGATGATPGTIVAVRDPDVDAAERRGWSEVRSFDAPVRMRIAGGRLTVGDREGDLTVALRDIESVEVRQHSNWKTALAMSAPIAGALLSALIVISYCKWQNGCFAPAQH